MSMDDKTEKTKTLAGLLDETFDSDVGPGPGTEPGPGLDDKVPRVSEVDVNGNVDTGATTGKRQVGYELYDVGISVVGEVEKKSGSQMKGTDGDQNIAEKLGNEVVDGGTEEDKSRVKHVFSVGDFVWGKIRTHPWWPGRIYDVSNASDYAQKFKTAGRLLVVYFGDGSFSWCPPSQLMPFVEQFDHMSKQSTSKSFLNAVDKALDEISVLAEFDMACRCISEENRVGLSWPMPMNAGIKKGVPVPEGKSTGLLLSKCGTSELLKGLKHHAETNTNTNLLEFVVLKSWLSAFHRAKCGRPLSLYCEPVLVEGLEDKKDQAIDGNDFSIPIEVPIQGPSEEEWLSSAKSGPDTGDKIYTRRKQKSVAELMGDNVKSKGRKVTGEDSTPSSAETSDKKKRSDNNVGKRLRDTESAERKQLSVSIPESDEIGDQLDLNAGPLSRERKKSKYLSPPYTTPTWTSAGKSSFKKEAETESQKISDMNRIGERMRKAAQFILSNSGNGDVKEKASEGFDDVDMSCGIKKCSTMDIINSPVDSVLSEVQSTARKPRLLGKGPLEKTRGFISMFRDSMYSEGSDYKKYHNIETGTKRKSKDDTKSLQPVPSHAKKRRTNHVEAETSSVILTVTFATGFSLPSEDEVFELYNKFGELNKEETKVLYDSNSVQIVYAHDSDAEEAFTESVKQSPFGDSKVNFKLSSSDALRTSVGESRERSLSSLKADKGKSKLELIKQKLKAVASSLEKCDGKITTEEKLELEGEMKDLLEKVVSIVTTNP